LRPALTRRRSTTGVSACSPVVGALGLAVGSRIMRVIGPSIEQCAWCFGWAGWSAWPPLASEAPLPHCHLPRCRLVDVEVVADDAGWCGVAVGKRQAAWPAGQLTRGFHMVRVLATTDTGHVVVRMDTVRLHES
jgi:hypothetical protein